MDRIVLSKENIATWSYVNTIFEVLTDLLELGESNESIGLFFGVSERTIFSWKKLFDVECLNQVKGINAFHKGLVLSYNKGGCADNGSGKAAITISTLESGDNIIPGGPSPAKKGDGEQV